MLSTSRSDPAAPSTELVTVSTWPVKSPAAGSFPAQAQAAGPHELTKELTAVRVRRTSHSDPERKSVTGVAGKSASQRPMVLRSCWTGLTPTFTV